MENNFVIVRKVRGVFTPCIVTDPASKKILDKFLARDMKESHDNPAKCVIAEYDNIQSDPIVKVRDRYGYKTWYGAMLAALSGWHFVKHRIRPVYRANSEGLRLIAEHGCPHKAFAALTR